MTTNFIYTGGPFNSMYERAIRSAIATQKSHTTILWWNGTRPNVTIPGLQVVEYQPSLDVATAVRQRDPTSRPDLSEEHWMRVVTKDVIFWELASSPGGLFLDLDTTSLRDVTHLLGDDDIVSPIDVPWNYSDPNVGWRNVAVLITRPNSQVAKVCLDRTAELLKRGNMSYFELGPKVLTDVLNARGFDKVFTPSHRMLGAFCGGSEAAAHLQNAYPMPDNAKVVHWFSSSAEMRAVDPALVHPRTRIEPWPREHVITRLVSGMARGAEVGVQEGVFSRKLLLAGVRHMTMIDAWRVFSAEEYNDGANVSELQQLRNMATAVEAVQEFSGRYDIVRDLSANAAKRYPDGHFDFVYLDANHRYESILEDVRIWAPKVRTGGIVCGHDYLDGELPQGSFGVKRAVNEYFGRPPDIVTDEYWPSFAYHI